MDHGHTKVNRRAVKQPSENKSLRNVLFLTVSKAIKRIREGSYLG